MTLYKKFYQCIQNDLLASSLSVGRGGLGVALAKTAMGGMLGIDVSLKNLKGSVKRNDDALFSESQGRIIVSINPHNKKIFEKIMQHVSLTLLGTVTDDGMFIIRDHDNAMLVKTDVEKLLISYKSTFKHY